MSQRTHSMTDDKNWPKLGSGKSATPSAGMASKPAATRSQPAGASGNPIDPPSTFNKTLTGKYYSFLVREASQYERKVGVGDQRLATEAVNQSLGSPARPPPARPSLKLSEPERGVKYSDIARRGSPPPSPTLPPTNILPLPKPNDIPATSAATLKRSKPSTQPLVAADGFPPLSFSPTTTSATKDKPAPTRKNSYAAATGTGTVKARPTVVTTGACTSITAGPSVSESPVSVLGPGSTAKVISIQIGGTRPVTPPPAARPSLAPRSSKRGKRASAPDNNTLYPPQLESRTRSASVSSVATSVAASSIITTSSRGPASSKTSVCHTPVNEDVEWHPKLAELAKKMSGSQRAAWEKILRSDPKDTSKMKWNAFDKALRALGFKAQARGGSETEYTPDPEYFGTKAQPISYHRPHPGADFTLGDLKAKSNSFRSQYPVAVAVLHDAWGLIDTRQ
ncbi:unnamed protein product [Rhizoctonia solani]|uniref:Uncharacterized protein n=1 Tax=Rhizoctonia solani TaxID=456999 RepID=A0A8H3HGR4_9AGAM|nr:unnamed protein product [Rhizoctonia solani]